MLPRLIVPGVSLSGAVQLSQEDRRHITGALRMREGEKLVLCDGNGLEALCVLNSNREAVVLETFSSQGEPLVPAHLYPSLAKGERFEWMLQKAAELGAVSITPVLSRRCIVGSPSEEKRERWRRIIRSAAEQSGRGIVPELRNAMLYNDVLSVAQGLRIFCYEEERTVSLRAVFREGTTETSVLTGPEGGYTPEEAESAVQNGWQPVSLGNTILRCETAPLMVLAAIRFNSMLP
jgi:16S rRNA (uracil1498-N3)-methyltransferase